MWLHSLWGFYNRENVGSKINSTKNYLKMYCLQKTVINLTDSQKGLFKLQGFSPLHCYQNQLQQIGRSIETDTELIHWHVKQFLSLNCILCLSLSFYFMVWSDLVLVQGFVLWCYRQDPSAFQTFACLCVFIPSRVFLPQRQLLSKEQFKTRHLTQSHLPTTFIWQW